MTMLPEEQNDPMATTHAEMALHGLLLAWLRRADAGRLPLVPEREMAAELVARFAAQMEHHDGQRRLVLYGEWEIDPAKVTYVPAVKGP